MKTRIVPIVAGSLIFLVAIALRVHFFGGFVLCDDPQEFGMANHTFFTGPIWTDHLHRRFVGWIFNWLAYAAFGVSEFSFFLPTFLFSASLGVIGYACLRHMDYSQMASFFGGLVVASAPFEVLLGTLRANDVFLGECLALGWLVMLAWQKRPVLQGVSLGILLWLGFYVKLFVVYSFPVLGIYYLVRLFKHHQWQGLASFTLTSAILHGGISVIWKWHIGSFLPFLGSHAATYPVPMDHIPALLQQYPTQLFLGSQFDTTLFGAIPYLVLLGLALKTIGSFSGFSFRWDRYDAWLAAYYISFFLLLNFFSTGFSLDEYYSPPRIFRYLTPISFPMALHVAKFILDGSVWFYRQGRLWRLVPVGVSAGVLILNLVQTAEATYPTTLYRNNLMPAVHYMREAEPPKVISEAVIGLYLDRVYLQDVEPKIEVERIYHTFTAWEYEEWLWANEEKMPPGTLLLTGIHGCVHYGPYGDGFRTIGFRKPLHRNWKLLREYSGLHYLPYPEPTRLWKWQP